MFNDYLNRLSGGGYDTYDLAIPSRTGTTCIGLTAEQFDEFQKRGKRKFRTLDDFGKLKADIAAAETLEDLVDFSLENDICDFCDFDGLHIENARILVNVVASCCYKYPHLRSRICFIGSNDSFCERLKSAANGNMNILVQFGLEKIISDVQTLQTVGDAALFSVENAIKNRDNYIALAVMVFGLFDAVIFDTQDFCKSKYDNLHRDLINNSAFGFHPDGCGTTKGITYHEMGHLLDFMLGVSSSAEFTAMRREYSPERIANELSEYATISAAEMLAEGFCEYMCRKNPRPLAKRIGEMIDRFYALRE